jgi:hypothetical protein
MYDPRLGRFLSLDKIAKVYSTQYSFAANNPLLYVDKGGNDNVIYLVFLPSAGEKLSREDALKIAQEANKIFEMMGVSTRVKFFEGNGAEPFNPSYIDKNDSYALLGSYEEIKAVVNNDDNYSVDSKEIVNKFYGGSTNPEISVPGNEETNKLGQGIFIQLDFISETADFAYISIPQSIAVITVHGATHNAGDLRRMGSDGYQRHSYYGINHPYPFNVLHENGGDIYDLVNDSDLKGLRERNSKTFGAGSGHSYGANSAPLGTNPDGPKSHDNYYRNKIIKEEGFDPGPNTLNNVIVTANNN